MDAESNIRRPAKDNDSHHHHHHHVQQRPLSSLSRSSTDKKTIIKRSKSHSFSSARACKCYQRLIHDQDNDDSFLINVDGNNLDANNDHVHNVDTIDGASDDEKKKGKYTKNQKWVLICVSMVSFTTYLLMAILAPFFPNEASKKGMSETLSGLVFSIYALIIMISSPIFGKLIPIVGPKFLLLSGILISGGSNVIFGLLDRTSDGVFFTVSCFVVRSMEGLGAAAFSTASFTYIMHTFPNDVSNAFGLVETFIGIGETIGPAVGGALYTIGGYGLPFYVLGSFVLLTIPLCAKKIKYIDVNAPPGVNNGGEVSNRMTVHIDDRVEGSYINLIKIPDMLIVCLIVVIGAQNQGFLEPTIEPHFRSFGLGAEYVSLVFLLMAVAYAVTSPLTGWASNQITNKYPIMICGLIVSTIGLLFLGPAQFVPIEPNLPTSTVAMVTMGISYALAFIPTFESMLLIAINHGFDDDITTYSLISGLWSSMFSLGEVIGPSLGGLLVDLYGFPVASTFMATFSLIAVIVTTVMYVYGPSWEPPNGESSDNSDGNNGQSDDGSDSGVVGVDRRRKEVVKNASSGHDEDDESCPLLIPDGGHRGRNRGITVSV